MANHSSLTPDNCPDCGHPHPAGPCLAWADVDAEATYDAAERHACGGCGCSFPAVCDDAACASYGDHAPHCAECGWTPDEDFTVDAKCDHCGKVAADLWAHRGEQWCAKCVQCDD